MNDTKNIWVLDLPLLDAAGETMLNIAGVVMFELGT